MKLQRVVSQEVADYDRYSIAVHHSGHSPEPYLVHLHREYTLLCGPTPHAG